jgi:predicted ribosome quality control (RQC) complex YloA/Tae2 family protein
MQLQDRATTGERLLALLRKVFTREQLRKTMNEHREEFEQLGVGPKSKAREEIPFRVFVVDGGFEVWAGKSSTNNDLLTLRYARPNDLWFHARGSGGSHVVLRVSSAGGQPGKKAKEQAAGIAAYYSKMRKANHVPVSMTHRKYVRKRKGSPPGTVHIEREKVIFATPALPAMQPH